LLHGEILGIQRTHLGQDAVEFGAVLAGVFPLQRGEEIALGSIFIEAFCLDERFGFALLLRLGVGKEGFNDARFVPEQIKMSAVTSKCTTCGHFKVHHL
jgi:hypothetical protein